MACGFDLVGCILNIAHVINVIQMHVKGYLALEGILNDAASKVRKIESDVRTLQQLHTLDGVQLQILDNTVQEFVEIRDELMSIKDKLAHRSVALKMLSSPEFIDELKGINRRLTSKHDILRIIGMTGVLNMEHRNNCDRIISLLTELSSRSPDESAIKDIFMRIFQTKMIENSAQALTERRNGSVIERKNGFMHLATGVCLCKGLLGIKDYEEAARHFYAAIKDGTSQAYYYLGLQHRDGQGVNTCHATAKNFFQIAADTGYVAARTRLGQCYHFGTGVEQDLERGTEYIKEAAEAEDPNGMSIYSYFKLFGIHTEMNLPLAFRMASKVNKQGSGRNELAHCYEQGIVVDRNPIEAARLYTESIESGDWIPSISLARLYEGGDGVVLDLTRAAECYKKATESSGWLRPYFQGYYGLCLIRGRGVFQDKKKGWKEINESIQANNGTGWFAKGECYRFGYGVEQDFPKAVKCYQSATETKDGMDGKIRAHFALGCMYELGEGLPRDDERAFDYFNYGANRLHQESQWKVGLACETGIGVNHFEARAVHYFMLAANSGHRDAQLKASKYYMKGKGIQRDLHTAIQILRPAAASGNRKAKHLLRLLKLRLFLRRESANPIRSAPSGMG